MRRAFTTLFVSTMISAVLSGCSLPFFQGNDINYDEQTAEAVARELDAINEAKERAREKYRVSGDEISDEEVSGNEVSENEVSGSADAEDEISLSTISGDAVFGDEAEEAETAETADTASKDDSSSSKLRSASSSVIEYELPVHERSPYADSFDTAAKNLLKAGYGTNFLMTDSGEALVISVWGDYDAKDMSLRLNELLKTGGDDARAYEHVVLMVRDTEDRDKILSVYRDGKRVH